MTIFPIKDVVMNLLAKAPDGKRIVLSNALPWALP
jgi:hypothetical protein